MSKLQKQITPIYLQYQIKKIGLSQRDVAKHFNVSDGAVSGAINNDPLLSALRIKIIQFLNNYRRQKKAS